MTEMLVAQLSENGLELGGLFNGIKVHVNEYEEIIDKFSKLTINNTFKDRDTGEILWDKISEAIGGADERAMSYFKTMDNGNGIIDNSSASVADMSDYLKATGQSFDFAAVKATLFNTALNAGIMLIASFVVQGVITAIDKYVNRVQYAVEAMEEAQDKIEKILITCNKNKKITKILLRFICTNPDNIIINQRKAVTTMKTIKKYAIYGICILIFSGVIILHTITVDHSARVQELNNALLKHHVEQITD